VPAVDKPVVLGVAGVVGSKVSENRA